MMTPERRAELRTDHADCTGDKGCVAYECLDEIDRLEALLPLRQPADPIYETHTASTLPELDRETIRQQADTIAHLDAECQAANEAFQRDAETIARLQKDRRHLVEYGMEGEDANGCDECQRIKAEIAAEIASEGEGEGKE